MDYKQRKAVEQIIESHSLKVFLRYLAVGVILVLVVVFFSQNIRSLRYAPLPILIIYAIGGVNFLASHFIIKALQKQNQPYNTIVQADFYFTFIDNLIGIIFIPVFSDIFVSPFWFIPIFAIALLLSLHEMKKIHLLILCICPFISYALFLGYHFLITGLFVFHIANLLFAAVISALIFYTHAIIIRRRYIHFLLYDDQEKALAFLNHYNISEREKDVFTLLLSGRSTKEIADQLYISAKTAENHISSIFRKTDTHSRIELYSAYNSFYPDIT
ncbi:MAG: helix-turn-helix domain-containing protein [Spirochaetia bacterium]